MGAELFAGFPAKRAEGPALCAPGPTRCMPPEGRPLCGWKVAAATFRLIMWDGYREASRRYPKLTLAQERRMIAAAKAGIKSARDELVLRHIGFLMWRLRTKVFWCHLERHGDDLLSAAILILYQKIHTYDLHYRDQGGVLKPVRFASYIWKRIDGMAIDHLKRESRSGVPFDETRHITALSNFPAKIRQKTLPARPI